MSFYFTKQTSNKFGNVELLHKLECVLCPLDKLEGNKNKHIQPHGATSPEVYIIGIGPGAEEDATGQFFCGPSGRLLKSCFSDFQLSKIRFNNVTRTRDPSNNPPYEAIECCRPSIEKDIAIAKPKAIFLLGGIALKWALNITTEEPINDWRGHHFPIKILGHTCWAFPMFHPSAILRAGQYSHVFKLDIKNAYAFLERDIKPQVENPLSYTSNIDILYDVNKIEHALELLKNDPSRKAVDIENTPVKPYSNGFRILSMSIGTYDHTIAFPWLHSQNRWSSQDFSRLRNVVGNFLGDAYIPKCAHNAAHEEEILAIEYNKKLIRANWHDTMAQAYCLGFGGRSKSSTTDQTQRGLLSLNNLCKVYFGFYLKDQSNVDVTNLDNEDLDDVLLYNGLDSKYDAKLYNFLDQDIKHEKLEEITLEHQRRIPTVVLTQIKGINYDEKTAIGHSERISKLLEIAYAKLFAEPSIQEYKARFGDLNPASSPDVANFYKYLGFNVTKTDEKTGKQTISVDDENLSKIDHVTVPLILTLRELNKLKSTYIDPIVNKTIIYPDNKLHPQYSTLFTTTGRSSSRLPNQQNWPARENKDIRDILVPSSGHVLVANDYGQIEFRCIGMITQDAKLVKYIWDDHDVHADWAWRIAKKYPKVVGGLKTLENKKAFKAFRSKVKNRWVFAAFYGAAAKSLAGYMGIPVAIALELYKEFWEEFAGVRLCNRALYDQYEKYGYVESLTGARRYAYMQGGEIINTPVQRLACDIVMDGMNRLSEYAVETGQDQFQAIMNIHDDLTFEIPEESLEHDVKHIIREMLNCKYPFVNVPLAVETSIGKNWYSMEPYGTFVSNNLSAIA